MGTLQHEIIGLTPSFLAKPHPQIVSFFRLDDVCRSIFMLLDGFTAASAAIVITKRGRRERKVC